MMRSFFWRAAAAAATVIAISGATFFVSDVNADEKDVPLDKLPKAVTDAVKKMFPKAEMLQASIEEEEDGETEYEVTIKENGKKIDVTVEADGKIESLEKEIDLKDLPKAVTDALEKKYPQATRKSAEAVYEVEDGEQELEFYEVQLKTADDKEIEAKVKAGGAIITKSADEDDDDEDEDKDKDKSDPKG